MKDFRKSSFQFSWVIKWLFLYQAFIQLFQNFSELGHNDDPSDSETFQYDPSLLYQYVFQLFHFNGGTITEILKTALGGYDPAVVTGALVECPESPIAQEKIGTATTYDHESRHDHFIVNFYDIYAGPNSICQRHVRVGSRAHVASASFFEKKMLSLPAQMPLAFAQDPFMGRFLQTDPMGYADSMNLYHFRSFKETAVVHFRKCQSHLLWAFNMNPFNFSDPMGKEWVWSGGNWSYYPSYLPGSKTKDTYRYLVKVERTIDVDTDQNTRSRHYKAKLYDNDKVIASADDLFSGGAREGDLTWGHIPEGNYRVDLSNPDEKGPQNAWGNNLNPNSTIQRIYDKELPPGRSTDDDSWNPYHAYGPFRARLYPFPDNKDQTQAARNNYFHGQNPVYGETHGCLSYGTDVRIVNKLWDVANKLNLKDADKKVVFAIEEPVGEPILKEKVNEK